MVLEALLFAAIETKTLSNKMWLKVDCEYEHLSYLWVSRVLSISTSFPEYGK